MAESFSIAPIARLYSDLPTKFGLPRQSGLVPELKGRIVFEAAYRNEAAFRGLEEFSHLWLIWGFSEVKDYRFTPMVKPPRLGGNIKKGVFATRSPFRPNNLGLSCVKLDGIDFEDPEGPVLWVSGPDLMSGTPIFDVKPYVPYSDSIPEAVGGFADKCRDYSLGAEIPEPWLSMIPEEKREALYGILAQDPRPAYIDDPERRYGFNYLDFDVRFRVADGVATVCEIVRL